MEYFVPSGVEAIVDLEDQGTLMGKMYGGAGKMYGGKMNGSPTSPPSSGPIPALEVGTPSGKNGGKMYGGKMTSSSDDAVPLDLADTPSGKHGGKMARGLMEYWY